MASDRAEPAPIPMLDQARGARSIRLRLAWTAACAIGGALVVGLVPALPTVGFLVAGPLIAAPQWLVLRRRIPRAGRWLVGTALAVPAALVAGTLAIVLSIWTESARLPPLELAIAAALVGLAQAAALWGTARDPLLWVASSALGGALLIGLHEALTAAGLVPPAPAFAGLIAGAGYGLVTSLALPRVIGRDAQGPR